MLVILNSSKGNLWFLSYLSKLEVFYEISQKACLCLSFYPFSYGANVYSLLKVFVIPSAVSTVSANTTSSTTASSTASTSTGKVTKTDTTYKDDNMDIKITTGKTSDTTYYVADIQLSSADYLKTALAQNTYGTNITDTTSSIASK